MQTIQLGDFGTVADNSQMFIVTNICRASLNVAVAVLTAFGSEDRKLIPLNENNETDVNWFSVVGNLFKLPKPVEHEIVFNAQISPDANVEQVRQRMLDRSIIGLKKYGVTTERNDLTPEQWIVHLEEELLDAVVYIQRVKAIIQLVVK